MQVTTSVDRKQKSSTVATMDHRGVFQAQGAGMQESEKWNQPQPLTAVDGHSLLESLREKIAPTEAAIRAGAFADAHGFIDAARIVGGAPQDNRYPLKKTFRVFPDPRGRRDRRVDIEVHAGRAFV